MDRGSFPVGVCVSVISLLHGKISFESAPDPTEPCMIYIFWCHVLKLHAVGYICGELKLGSVLADRLPWPVSAQGQFDGRGKLFASLSQPYSVMCVLTHTSEVWT